DSAGPRALPRGAPVRALHPRAERSRVRGGGRRVSRRAADDRGRERHGRDLARPRRARYRRRRRGDLPRIHVLRDGGADRACRRRPRLRGHRPGDAEPRPRGRRRPDHGADEGDRRGAPVRATRAGRRARPARPARDRGRRAGVRLEGRCDDRHRLDVQLLPVEEPVRPRRRRPRRGHRRGAGRAALDAPLPRVARQAALRLRRRQLAPRRAAGGRAPALPAPPRRLERRPPPGSRALRRARPRRALRVTARRAGARLPHVLRPFARARSAARSAAGGRHRARGPLRDAAPPPAGDVVPRVLRGRSPRDRGRLAREPLSAALAVDRTGAAGARRGGRARGARRPGGRAMTINRHRLWQLAADAGLIALAWFLAFQLRFDNGPPKPYERIFDRTILIVIGVKMAVFVLSGFHNRWWRYVSMKDMWAAVRGVTIACLVADLIVYFLHPVRGFSLPRSVAVMDWLLLLAFVAGSRLFARTLFERPSAAQIVARGKEVVVVGAGDAGQLIVKEMQRNPHLGYTPIGFVDDKTQLRGTRIHDVRVLGRTGDLAHILRDQRPDELLIAIPSASGQVRQQIVSIAREAGVPVKTLPGLHELITGDVDLAGGIRPVQVEDV